MTIFYNIAKTALPSVVLVVKDAKVRAVKIEQRFNDDLEVGTPRVLYSALRFAAKAHFSNEFAINVHSK